MMVDSARIGGRAFWTVNNVPFAFTPKTLSKFDSFMAPSGLLLFGPVTKPIAQSRNITCRRFRQRLCVKHRRAGKGEYEFSVGDNVNLSSRAGCVNTLTAPVQFDKRGCGNGGTVRYRGTGNRKGQTRLHQVSVRKIILIHG